MKNLATRNTTDYEVLPNGEAYVSQRKAAELCGVALSTFQNFSRSNNLNIKQGVSVKNLSFSVSYYAKKGRSEAIDTLDMFAEAGAKAFVYYQAGYVASYDKPNNSHVPVFMQRYHMNAHKIPFDMFSIINQVMLEIAAPMEREGYIIPEDMCIDISVGGVYCKHLRTQGVDTKRLKTYVHEYPDGRKIRGVKMYPIELLPDFNRFFNQVWMLDYASKYCGRKDQKALSVFQQLRLGYGA